MTTVPIAPVLPGSCLCGAVRWEQRGPFLHVMHCHCSVCRKHHGSSFATYGASPLDGFRWVTGADHQGRYDSSPTWYRPFCLSCGSVLPTMLPEHSVAVTPIGTLDGDPGVRPEGHMFAASRAPWYDITDGLPTHDAYPPGSLGMAQPDRPREPAVTGCTRGSCACGQVRYEFEGPPIRMLNCHCSRCRHARSAAHATNLFVALDNFRFRQGEDQVKDFQLPGARYFGVAFCTDCGGHVPRISVERKAAVIPAGTLDDDPGMRPAAHIFVESKASWFDITDPLPRFPAMPG